MLIHTTYAARPSAKLAAREPDSAVKVALADGSSVGEFAANLTAATETYVLGCPTDQVNAGSRRPAQPGLLTSAHECLPSTCSSSVGHPAGSEARGGKAALRDRRGQLKRGSHAWAPRSCSRPQNNSAPAG